MQFILTELLIEIILTPRLKNDMIHTEYPALLILFAEHVMISVFSSVSNHLVLISCCQYDFATV